MEPEVLEFIDGDDTHFEREPLERLAAAGKPVTIAMALSGSAWILCTRRDIWTGLWESGKAPWKTWSDAWPGRMMSPWGNLSRQRGWRGNRDMNPAGSPGRDLPTESESKEVGCAAACVHNVIALYGVQACPLCASAAYVSLPGARAGPFGLGSCNFCASDWRCDRERRGVWLRHFGSAGYFAPPQRTETSLSADLRRVRCEVSAGDFMHCGGDLRAALYSPHCSVVGAVLGQHHLGCVPGYRLLWYFQGLERMRLASILEISGKVLATLSIFVLVRKPSDGWKVMAAQCVGCVVAHGVTVVLAYREVGFQWPTPASVWNSLRLGTSMFLFRAVQTICGSANRLILGSAAPVAVLGHYAGAERITRVFNQGMWPVNQALYPRLTKQMQDSPGQAMKTVKYSLLLLGGLGMVCGLGVYLGAPLLVHLVLGPRFGDSVPVLRVFALWIPMSAVTMVMIFQLLLPNQLDNQFNFTNYTAGGLGVVVSLLLVPRMGGVGIAWSWVASQVYTLVAFIIVLWRAGLNPFSVTVSTRLRPPSLSDLAAFSGTDHEEAPVEFARNEPQALAEDGLIEEKR